MYYCRPPIAYVRECISLIRRGERRGGVAHQKIYAFPLGTKILEENFWWLSLGEMNIRTHENDYIFCKKRVYGHAKKHIKDRHCTVGLGQRERVDKEARADCRYALKLESGT